MSFETDVGVNGGESETTDGTVQSPPTVSQGTRRRALIAFILLLAAIPAGYTLGAHGATFATTGLTYLPFVVVAALAYLGQRHTVARVLAVLSVLVLFTALSFAVIGLSIASVVNILGAPDTVNLASDPQLLATIVILASGSFLAFLFACLGFVPGIRRALARVLPLRAESFVHTIALVTVTGFTLISFVPLLVLGEPPLLSENVMESIGEQDMAEAEGLLSLIYTLVWSIPIAVFAVGYGIRRNFRHTLSRLGLVMPSLIQILVGVVTAVVLVVAVSALEIGIDSLWRLFGWPRTDAEAFSELLSFAFTPLGAVVVGVSAGLGEELAVRGVLQPRLGILLSNLFFAGLHALQYNWDSVLVVFLVGAAFGVIRRYTNTSTSAISHGMYDFILIMMTVYQFSLFGS